MIRRNRILLITQNLFIKLLTGTQTSKLYFNIFTRNVSCKANHFLCQIYNLHRFTHIENKYLITGTHCGSLHYQTAGLGNSHKETGNPGISNGNGAAFLYLFSKIWNHTAITAKYIAKTGSYKRRFSFHLAMFHSKP